MRSLLDLARQCENLSEEIADESNKQKIKVAETILGDLVHVTPVDTSKALSNWQAAIGTKKSGKIEPYYPGEHGSTKTASARAAFEAGRAIIRGAKPGEPIIISNNLPYIRRLNDGYSKQAPAGFVDRAILLGRRIVTRFKLKK